MGDDLMHNADVHSVLVKHSKNLRKVYNKFCFIFGWTIEDPNKSMCMNEWTELLEWAGLLSADLTVREARSAFIDSQAEPLDVDSIDEGDASIQMSYGEFKECIVRCAMNMKAAK